jgi:predicted RNA-binding Zn-ribbon protein involved in translation (DUF1610 family)
MPVLEVERDLGDGRPMRCDVCGQLVLEVRCKFVCPRCGYTRDCTDP